jgi:hypothetical protein
VMQACNVLERPSNGREPPHREVGTFTDT